jgi:hypothetical protein
MVVPVTVNHMVGVRIPTWEPHVKRLSRLIEDEVAIACKELRALERCTTHLTKEESWRGTTSTTYRLRNSARLRSKASSSTRCHSLSGKPSEGTSRLVHVISISIIGRRSLLKPLKLSDNTNKKENTWKHGVMASATLSKRVQPYGCRGSSPLVSADHR